MRCTKGGEIGAQVSALVEVDGCEQMRESIYMKCIIITIVISIVSITIGFSVIRYEAI